MVAAAAPVVERILHDLRRKVLLALPWVLLVLNPNLLSCLPSSPGPDRQSIMCWMFVWTLHTFCCCLWSFKTSSTSVVNESKPSRYRKVSGGWSSSNTRTFSAPMICSGAIVFFDSCSHISFASEEIKWMNSSNMCELQRGREDRWRCSPTQHSMTRSRVSFAHVTSAGRSSKSQMIGNSTNERHTRKVTYH